MRIDCHNHTTFSSDGRQTIPELIAAAAERGVGYVALTEHMDLGFPNGARPSDEPLFEYLVTRRYFDEIAALRPLYPHMRIVAGIEVGFTAGDEDRISAALSQFPFEYIINSVHICHGLDCYWAGYFDGYTKASSYGEYLDCVRASLDAPYPYDAVGHLGYIARAADYPDRRLLYSEFADKLDDILRVIIRRGKILEVNSSVGKSAANGALTIPDPTILRRYRELGGELINFGSDSHYTSRFNANYSGVCTLLKDIGFKEFTIKYDGTLRSEAID